MEGRLSFTSQGIGSELTLSGGDPKQVLTEEQLKAIVRDCRLAIEAVIKQHLPELEEVPGNRFG